MVAIVLVVLGVPLWLVVGVLLGALYSRHRFKQAPGVFRCHLRLVAGSMSSVKETWGRVPAHGRWVHDVFLVNRGLALVRVAPFPVAGVVAGPDKGDPAAIKRLGPAPVVLTLRVDGGATIAIAAADQDSTTMLGPFADTTVPPAANR